MYVDYLEYQKFTSEKIPMNEDDYKRASLFADVYIDNWTLDRVGRAVDNGENLPDSVKIVYCGIVDNAQNMQPGGELVTSFSNGVDSYTFAAEKTTEDQLKSWAINLLPVEWISGAIDYKGGNREG